MKTLQIENTREIFFNDSKEQYLHFKQIWSQAVNSDKAKKTVEFEPTFEYTYRKDGWLTSAHHLIYALIRGGDAYKAFTPVTKKSKLENGAYLNYGLHMARWYLSYFANRANQYVADVEGGKQKLSIFGKKRVIQKDHSQLEEFLLPFDGTITPQMIIKLDELCPDVKPIESSYGKGKQLAQKIISGEVKPITYGEMQEMYA
jgi:hypothetical protein